MGITEITEQMVVSTVFYENLSVISCQLRADMIHQQPLVTDNRQPTTDNYSEGAFAGVLTVSISEIESTMPTMATSTGIRFPGITLTASPPVTI